MLAEDARRVQNSSRMSIESPPLQKSERWYAGVSRYQWLVLIVASAGWIFDIFENQLFVITRSTMLPQLLHAPASSPAVKYYSDAINSYFLIGGAVGGVLFGIIADRFGRTRSMILSIIVYATFTALTALATSVHQVAMLRFFVAVGTGGEWAVAAALVAETFPRRARAQASGIFHASSVLGVAAAGWAGMATGTHWRSAYLVGLAPALLVLVIRLYIREPEKFEHAAAGPAIRHGLREFWTNRLYRTRAILGLLLAAVGLAGYWCVFAAGQDLVRTFLTTHGIDATTAEGKAKFAYSTVQNFGGAGVGLFAMGPLCAWLGRRGAFVVMQAGVLVVTPIVCFAPATYMQLLLLLPLLGFFVAGMHAGYAVWFPELFPARIRATGAGVCFNGARLVAALALMLSGWLKARPGMDLRMAVTILSAVYIPGIIIALLLPETKGAALEE
jgi:MFS family permease